ncbi:putative Lipoprotein [Tenacibaculum aestuariivivum]
MKTLRLYQLLLITTVMFFINCTSDKNNDCSKDVNQDYIVGIGGKAFYYTKKIQTSCDEDNQEADLIDGELPLLENFEYNVLNFEFNPDKGNNTSRLYFEVELKNPNNFDAKGLTVFKMNTNGNLDFETTYEPFLKQFCEIIEANSSCIIIVEIEGYNGGNNLGTIELLDIEYALVRKNR